MLTFPKAIELKYDFRFIDTKTENSEADLKASSFLLWANMAKYKLQTFVAKNVLQCPVASNFVLC